jgi:outer membrane protein TolC
MLKLTMQRSNLVLVLTLVLASVFQFSNTQAQDTLSLFDAISIGLERSFSIRIARNNLEISKNNSTAGNAGMLPRADLNANQSSSFYNRDIDYADGTSSSSALYPTHALTAGAQLSWTVFDGFAMFARKERLGMLFQQGDLYLKMEVEDAIANIAQTYYALTQSEKLQKWYEEQQELSAKRMNIASEKSRIGAGSELLAMQARVDFRADSALALKQRLMVANLKAELNRLMGRAPESSLVVNAGFKIPKPWNYVEVISKLSNENLEMQNANVQIRIAELEEREQKAQRMPQVNIFGAYNYSRTSTPEGQTTLFNTLGPAAGIGASITLFNGFNVNRRIKNASLTADNRRLQAEDLALRLRTIAYRLTNELSLALELLQVEQKSVELAIRNSEIAWERYRLGAISDLELREDQNRLLNARYRLITAQANAQLAEIELMKLMGNLSGILSDK